MISGLGILWVLLLRPAPQLQIPIHTAAKMIFVMSFMKTFVRGDFLGMNGKRGIKVLLALLQLNNLSPLFRG